MANTTPDNIYFPATADPVTPLASRLASMSNSVQTALNAHPYRVADLNALRDLTGMQTGFLAVVAEGGALFQYNGTAWIQSSAATFATLAARDTAYAKASGVYLVVGATSFIAARGFIEGWFPAVASTATQPAFSAGWDALPAIARMPRWRAGLRRNGNSLALSANDNTPLEVNALLVSTGGFTHTNGTGATTTSIVTPVPGTYQVVMEIRTDSPNARWSYASLNPGGTFQQILGGSAEQNSPGGFDAFTVQGTYFTENGTLSINPRVGMNTAGSLRINIDLSIAMIGG